METWVVPNMRTDDYLELSSKNRTQRKVIGRLFRKQILHEGSFIHPNNPGKRVVIDKKFAEDLVRNFNEGNDIVQFPVVDDSNRHSEDPLRNMGEVVGLSYKPGVGVFADIDVRKNAEEVGKTIIGGSAMIAMSHQNKITGESRSPVLLHVAATNRPFIPGLDAFQEIASLSDTTENDEVVLLTEEKEKEEVSLSDNENTGGNAMSKDELIAALKEQGIDVADLQRRAAAVEDIAALSNVLGEDSKLSLSELAEASLELDTKNNELTVQLSEAQEKLGVLEKERDELLLSKAEAEVDALIEEGRIFPKAREKMIELSMKDRETFDALVPDEPIVKLSDEQTVTTFTNADGEEEKLSAEVERYVAMQAK